MGPRGACNGNVATPSLAPEFPCPSGRPLSPLSQTLYNSTSPLGSETLPGRGTIVLEHRGRELAQVGSAYVLALRLMSPSISLSQYRGYSPITGHRSPPVRFSVVGASMRSGGGRPRGVMPRANDCRILCTPKRATVRRWLLCMGFPDGGGPGRSRFGPSCPSLLTRSVHFFCFIRVVPFLPWTQEHGIQ